MREEERLTPAEAEFEAALRGLQPAGPSISRDEVMYEAGYAAARRRNRLWQGATVLLAIGLGTSLAVQGLAPQSAKTPQLAGKPEATSVPRSILTEYQEESRPPRNSCSYIVLRNEVLAKGLAALPSPRTGSDSDEPPLTIRSMLGRGPRSAEAGTVDPYGDVVMPGGRS